MIDIEAERILAGVAMDLLLVMIGFLLVVECGHWLWGAFARDRTAFLDANRGDLR